MWLLSSRDGKRIIHEKYSNDYFWVYALRFAADSFSPRPGPCRQHSRWPPRLLPLSCNRRRHDYFYRGRRSVGGECPRWSGEEVDVESWRGIVRGDLAGRPDGCVQRGV